MSLEKVGKSKVFVGRRPETSTPFVDAKIKTLFAVHLDSKLKKELEQKGIKVHIIPTIMDPIVSPKLISEITRTANHTRGRVAFTCMAGAHVSNAYAGIYLAQKGWPLTKIMDALDKVSVKTSKQHISPGLAEGIMETIKFSHKNFLETIKSVKRASVKKPAKKKVVKKKTKSRRK